jgi:hypothetical protein
MRPVISIHVPKTAGTSFRQALEQIHSPSEIFLDYQESLDDVNSSYYRRRTDWLRDAALLSRRLPSQVRVIHGHFSAAKYAAAFPKAWWLVWLRHPISRLISHYFFWRTFPVELAPQHVFFRSVREGKLSFREFALAPVLRNIVARVFLEGRSLRRFQFVGLTEHYHEDICDLQRLLGWPAIVPTFTNANEYPAYRAEADALLADRDLIQLLESHHELDLQLYREAERLRAERLTLQSAHVLVPS